MGYDIERYFRTTARWIQEHRSEYRFHAPRGNSKTGDIPAWNVLPGFTCTACANRTCLREGCYALKNALRAGYDPNKSAVLRAWCENTIAIMHHLPQWFRDMDQWLTDNAPEEMRIHAAGDLQSRAYANAWFMLIVRHPKTRFLLFTKKWTALREIPFFALRNCSPVPSGWTGCEIPQDIADGYRCAWCDDGKETRIPEDAILCPGSCAECKACWKLSELKRDVRFIKH